MAALADYAHSLNLKFGLYSSNSPKTCAGRPGSFGYEYQDARTYAKWGVSLLKYDNCGDQNTIGPPERGYSVMRDALNASGRQIYFAACEWAVDFPSTWMGPVANSWRTTYDIQNMWECVIPHVDWTNIFAKFSGPGHFPDMDILEVGNGVLTPEEERAHFSLWAVMKSPLLVSCDLSTAPCRASLPLLLSKEVLAISQDPLGVPAVRVFASPDPPGIPFGKSGTCGKEELPQNTVIAPCDATDPLQTWDLLQNGTIVMKATGECLQLDSGQGGCCAQDWSVWTNNVASSLCNDPASCCNSHQELWSYTPGGLLLNNASQQCLTVHAGGMHNVGASPCTLALQGLQTWDFRANTGQFVSSVVPPGSVDSCLARTPEVRGGATEVFAGPLQNGDVVALFFNRNAPAGANITVTLSTTGIKTPSARVRDVLNSRDLGVASGTISATNLGVHDVAVFRLTPV